MQIVVVVWNYIYIYIYLLFLQMKREGVKLDAISYVRFLKACASQLALEWDIRHGGFELDERVGSALIQMYAKCGCIEEAKQAFEILTNHTVISWTAMIGAYAFGSRVEAHKLYLIQLCLQMK